MSRVYVFKIRRIAFFIALGLMIGLGYFYINAQTSQSVEGQPVQETQERVIHMVTGEFKTQKDGKEIEAYRWDPGTIIVNKGEKVTLRIYGVNGDRHPFIIEGLNIKDEVTKGNETVISFTPEKKGIYRIICLTHPDIENNGPMIGYIVVD
jgi:heme/copper-type cytochrome/quinol oxidase subunit 2